MMETYCQILEIAGRIHIRLINQNTDKIFETFCASPDSNTFPHHFHIKIYSSNFKFYSNYFLASVTGRRPNGIPTQTLRFSNAWHTNLFTNLCYLWNLPFRLKDLAVLCFD